MVSMKLEISFLLVALLGFVACQKYYIRNKENKLFVEASDRYLSLQPHKKDSEAQKWKVQYLSPGQYALVNDAEKKVLDVEFRVQHPSKAIVYHKHKLDNQRFFLNVDKSIVAQSANDSSVKVALTPEGNNGLAFLPYKDENLAQKFDFIEAKEEN